MDDHFRSTFDQAAIGISHVAPDGHFLRVNRWFCGMVGYSEKELLAKNFQEITHPEDLDRDLNLARKTLSGERKNHTIEKRYIKKDGEPLWVSLTASLVRSESGDPDYFIVLIEDIHSRKRTEQQLRSLSLAIDQSREGIAVTDMDGIILFINESFAAMHGYTPSEVLGKHLTIFHSPEQLEEVEKINYRLRSAVDFHGEVPHHHRDGTNFPGLMHCTSLCDDKGKPTGLITSLRDITASKRTEEKLAILNDQLRKLTAYMHSTREKENTKIAQWIHDELGQELTKLKIDLVWLGKRLHGDQITLLEKTLSMEKNIDRTIEAVQRISRELRPNMLDDLGLVDSIEWFSLDFEKRTGILCNFVAESADMDFGKDISTTIFRILKEGMTNIFHHSGASESDVSLYNDSDQVTLEIKDNGCGISNHDATSPESFGLMQIQERAGYLNGTVRIKGIPDVGTIIKISLPIPP